MTAAPGAAPAAKAPAPAAQAAAPAPAKPAPLDLATLETRLKQTDAIGTFTKLALKNEVDDLIDRFREYHQGRAGRGVPELRQAFNLLMMKVLTLLQDEDPPLAGAIASSREALWSVLADKAQFSKI